MTEDFYDAIYDAVINRYLDEAYIQKKIQSEAAAESINKRISILQKDLAGKMVKKIFYNREDDKVTFEIEYL